MELVSIIVPIYNVDKYLNECIESILNQTYKNIELILVNDGSTDSSLEICNVYKEKDSRVEIINKTNSGVSDTRNQGVKKALGKYLCFVDADDTLDHKFVEIMANEILNTDADVVFCSYMYNYEGKLIPKKPRLKTGIYSIEEIKHKLIDDGTMSGILFGSVWCAIYKKSIIEQNNIKFYKEIKNNEDGIFNIEYCLYSKKMGVLSDLYLYMYRQIEGSASKVNSLENKTEHASKKIIEVCKMQFSKIDLEQQLGARNVSEAFWMILMLCSKNNKDTYNITINNLKMLLCNQKLRNSYKYINTSEISRYKNIYFMLMKNQKVWVLYIITRFIYPFLVNKISR
ncbi:glycosyltransferase family 2 protein [Peribacillus butanolivorans]|uniref:glycosyltransferase family 2 protein n=1 Tax=Peribacillus butanolivorans TaxID=421767 RepID=UPI0036DAED02